MERLAIERGTVAENISESGASIITSLNAYVGDRIKIQSKKYKFYKGKMMF